MNQSIVVVSGGLGTPSTSGLLGRQLAESAASELAAMGFQAEVTVLELRDYATDITNNLLTGYAPPRLQEAIDSVVTAGALVMVSPVFTASVSGLFKSFIDVLDPKSLEEKPVILAATGGSPRHNLVIDYAMRPILATCAPKSCPPAFLPRRKTGARTRGLVPWPIVNGLPGANWRWQ